jgi:hypothetical protein
MPIYRDFTTYPDVSHTSTITTRRYQMTDILSTFCGLSRITSAQANVHNIADGHASTPAALL